MTPRKILRQREETARKSLRSYFYELNEVDRARFAKLCGTKVAYIVQQISGVRLIQPRLAMLMEIHSGGALVAEELSPKAPWQEWHRCRLRRAAPGDVVASHLR